MRVVAEDVPDDVRQPFLDHAVAGEIDRRRERGRRSGPWNSTASPAWRARSTSSPACAIPGTGADGVPSSVSRSTPSSWRSSANAARPPEARSIERTHALGVRHRRHTRGGLGLHDEHRHVVGDDVMQFAGDALTFEQTRRFHRLCLLGPQRGVAALECRDLVVSRPQQFADRRRDHQHAARRRPSRAHQGRP